MDAVTRDRALALAGVLEDRGRPHPGQRYKHGWIPLFGRKKGLAGPALAGPTADPPRPSSTNELDALHGASKRKRLLDLGLDPDEIYRLLGNSDMPTSMSDLDYELQGLSQADKASVLLAWGIPPDEIPGLLGRPAPSRSGIVEGELRNDPLVRHRVLTVAGVVPPLDVAVEALVAAIRHIADGETRAWSAAEAAKHPRVKGGPRGGEFKSVFDRMVDALTTWSRGEGPADPFEGQFTRKQMRETAKQLGLNPRPRIPDKDLKNLLFAHIRANVQHPVDRPRASFTLKGPDHRDLDVGVYVENKAGSKIFLRREKDGKPGTILQSFDDLDALHAWASEHGETDLADWARSEQTPAKAPRKAAKKAAPDSTAEHLAHQQIGFDVAPFGEPVAPSKVPVKRVPGKKAAPKATPDTPTTGVELRDSMRRYLKYVPTEPEPRLAAYFAERLDALAGLDPTDAAALRKAAAEFQDAANSYRKTAGMRLANNPRSSRMYKYGQQGAELADQLENVSDALTRLALKADSPPDREAPSAIGADRSFGERLAAAQQGPRVEDLPPVQIEVDASAGSETGRWRAKSVTGYDGPASGLLAAATARVRNSGGQANDRLRFPEGRPLAAWEEVLPSSRLKDAAAGDRHIKALDRAMEQSRLPADIVVWRGMRPSTVGMPDSDAVGFEWTDPGYVGTSARRDVAANDFGGRGAVLRLLVPAGTPAIGIHGGGEGEVMLNRGRRFTVIAERRTPTGGREIDVEVLPDEAPTGKATARTPRKSAIPPAEQAARDRQVKVDRASSVHDLVSEVDQLLTDGASDRALKARITSRAKVSNTPPDVRDRLLAAVGDEPAMRQVLADIRREEGLSPIGEAGAGARFDPALHESIGGDIPLGAPVTVVKPGHRFDGAGVGPDGADGVTFPARVEAGEPMSAAPKLDREEIAKIVESGLSDEGKRRILTSNGVPQSEWPESLRPKPTVKAPEPTAAERLAAGYPDPPDGVSEDQWLAMSYSERLAALVAARPSAPSVPTANDLAARLATVATEDEGVALLQGVKTKADLQALAHAVDVEYAPSDSLATLRAAILRQTVSRRLEHEGYRRRATPVTNDQALAPAPSVPTKATPAATDARAVLDAPPVHVSARSIGRTVDDVRGLDHLTPAQREKVIDAVAAYRGLGYSGINQHLRTGQPARGAKGIVAGIDLGMAQSRLPHDVTVYRSVKTGESTFGPPASWPDDLTGREWADPAYASTTASQDIMAAQDNARVVMRVHVPAGTGAMKLSDHEMEILLQRGLRYRVTADHGPTEMTDGWGRTHRFDRLLDVEVIGPDPSTDVVAQLRAATSRDAAREALKGKTKAQLLAIADAGGFVIGRPNGTRADVEHDLIATAVGHRLDFQTITSGSWSSSPRPAKKAVSKATPPGATAVDLPFLRSLTTEGRRDALDLRLKPDLQALLKSMGLPVSGTKRELVDRLVNGLEVSVTRSVDLDLEDYLDIDEDEDDLELEEVADGEPARSLDPEVRARVLALAGIETRMAGHDVTPGHDKLHHYWTKNPEGLAKWIKSPHQWTALYHHLVKYVNPEMAKRMASEWLHEVTGEWAGSDIHRVHSGKPPRGDRIGPG